MIITKLQRQIAFDETVEPYILLIQLFESQKEKKNRTEWCSSSLLPACVAAPKRIIPVSTAARVLELSKISARDLFSAAVYGRKPTGVTSRLLCRKLEYWAQRDFLIYLGVFRPKINKWWRIRRTEKRGWCFSPILIRPERKNIFVLFQIKYPTRSFLLRFTPCVCQIESGSL